MVQVSTQMQWGDWGTFNRQVVQALTDFPLMCKCTRGSSRAASYKAVPKSCPSHQLLYGLDAAESLCRYEPMLVKAANSTLKGCSDADVIRAQLVMIQVGGVEWDGGASKEAGLSR
jgi:hypothetical protein